MRRIFTCLILVYNAIALSGCTHTQLRWNTTRQVRTLTDIYEQQVLDNLARFVHDPNSLPSFAYPNQGGSDVTDGGNAGSDTGWTGLGFDSQKLSLGASRSMKEAWTLTPVYDVRRLELMRCAYQHALYCAGMCSTSSCCPDCDKLQRAFYLGDASAKYDSKDYPIDVLATFSAKTGRTTPACFEAVAWLECGSRKCVPKDCGCVKVGHYCGTYVWVLPGGQNELTKLTFTILDYALSAQAQAPNRTKDVTMYFDSRGFLILDKDAAAIEIKTTVPFDKAVPLATVTELNTKPFGIADFPDWKNLAIDQQKAIRNAIDPAFVDTPHGITDLTDEQQKALEDAREKARQGKVVKELIGEPSSDPLLPPISTPSNGSFNPLQFDLYRRTLTSP